ncbi:methyltransferase [Candidatus Woesearchaeota archaeon]|nr:methyltransferase [Candidatus Woesearchaeota archaeon]
MYQPAEDSELLRKQVKQHSEGKVLDMGTGSGIQAIEASKKKRVTAVLAVDINPKAVEELTKRIKKEKIKKIKIQQSDLFSKIKGKFDTIVFNPPYLPQDKGIEDKALYGGKKGYEVLEKFLNQVNPFLHEKGTVLILFSSLTNQEKVKQIIERNLLEFKELEKEHFFFEDLFVYKLVKNKVLHELEKKGVQRIAYLAHGKRGNVFLGRYNGKKIAIKMKRKESLAVERIKNEVKWLKVLNQKKIGPKLLFHGKNYLVYQFVDGEFILDWIKKAKKKDAKTILKVIMKQCYEMDKLGVNKEEMHRPLKHILIKKGKATLIDAGRSKTSGMLRKTKGFSGTPEISLKFLNVSKTTLVVLIDFERCYQTKKPHNVTQFGEFLSRYKLIKKDIRKFLSDYKKDRTKNNFDKILNLI